MKVIFQHPTNEEDKEGLDPSPLFERRRRLKPTVKIERRLSQEINPVAEGPPQVPKNKRNGLTDIY